MLAATVAASTPAWTGGPIYDDWLMRESEDMRALADVARAFVRTSGDYFRHAERSPVGGVTYRPLAHASLIGVQALGGAWLAHHAVSLALHLLGVLATWAALRLRGAAWLALVVAGVWALHPVQVEAYGWVNGRSDVLAGAFVAALAWASMGPVGVGRLLAAFAAAAGAVLAKETAVFAVAALAVASALPGTGLPARSAMREAARRIAAPFAGVLAALALRALTVGLAQAGVAALTAEPDLWVKSARLSGLALAHLWVPVPRAMAGLAWQLAQPLSWPEVALCVLALIGLATLALRRRFRALALIGGAMLTLAPTVVVSSAFWCGFDRYLYMPTLLLALAVPEIVTARAVRVRWPAALGLTALGLGLALSTSATSAYYHSQSAFMASMITLRPEDPSGYLFGAQWLSAGGKRAEALRLLDGVPRRGLPRPLASALATRLAALGQRATAIEVLDDMVARYPADPYAQLDLLWTSIQRGDLPRAFAAAERLRPVRGFCEGAQQQLERGARRPGVDVARIRAFRASYRCP